MRSLLFSTLFSLLISHLTFSQENNDWQYRFERKNCECTVVRFDLQQNLIIVPIFINDSDTLRFVFDSGARYIIITSLGAGKTLNLNYAKKTFMSGLGRGEDIEALISHRNQVRIGSLEINHQLVGVLMNDIFHLEKQLGTVVHGIIGMNIFKDFIIKIDYTRRKLHICKSWKKLKKDNKENFLPFEIIGEKPYIRAVAQLPDAQTDSFKLLLDTGAGHALMLTLPENTNWLQNLPESYLGSGLNGQIFGRVGKVKQLNFGAARFENVNTSFPDTLSLRAFYLQMTADGSIGAEVMRRFDWVFDYTEKRVYYKPNARYQAPFRVNMSGMEVSKPLKDLSFFWVDNVRKNSPAERAGVREGDQIFALNGKTGNDLNMNFIAESLQKEPGTKIKITLLRQGKKIKVEFLLSEELDF